MRKVDLVWLHIMLVPSLHHDVAYVHIILWGYWLSWVRVIWFYVRYVDHLYAYWCSQVFSPQVLWIQYSLVWRFHLSMLSFMYFCSVVSLTFPREGIISYGREYFRTIHSFTHMVVQSIMWDSIILYDPRKASHMAHGECSHWSQR